jgi:hypothetical protein
MRDLVPGILGIAMVVTFLGIMVWWVKAVPLILIVIGVMALLIYDWVMTVRYGVSGRPEEG